MLYTRIFSLNLDQCKTSGKNIELKIVILFDNSDLNLDKNCIDFQTLPLLMKYLETFCSCKTFKKCLQEEARSNNNQRD